MPRRVRPALLLLALSAGVRAEEPAVAPQKKEPEKSQWVFSILPKAFQKNPLLDLTVITEMTDAGRKLPPVSPEHPVYFQPFSSGYHELGDPSGGTKTLRQEDIEKLLVRALAANGYRPAKMPEQPPAILLLYTWGTHSRREEGDEDNPSLSPQQVAANILDRAALVGGQKFADKLAKLFEEADAMNTAANVPTPPGGQPVMAPIMDFANPVAMFRRQSIKNENLLEQTANDIYYVVASAYDYRSASSNKRVLLWRTRMTVAAQGVSQLQTLPTLVLSAAPYFGKDMAETELISKRPVPEGTVEIGTPVVVPGPADVKPAKKK